MTSAWPSAYGYKYTPIGLRQREIKVNDGRRTISTTVHLPEGGHLFDITRGYNSDGSKDKRETNQLGGGGGYSPTSAPRPAALDRPGPSEAERSADDIIANFRARHAAGLDMYF